MKRAVAKSHFMNETSVDTICQELCTFIRTSVVDKNVVVEPNTVFSKIGIDSLSIIELVLFLERKYAITLPEEELLPENFHTALTLAQCAYRHL